MKNSKSLRQYFLEFSIYLSFAYILYFSVHETLLFWLSYIAAYSIGLFFDMTLFITTIDQNITLISHQALQNSFTGEIGYAKIVFDANYLEQLEHVISKVPLIFALLLLFAKKAKPILITLFITFAVILITIVTVMFDSIFLYATQVALFKAFISSYISSNLIIDFFAFTHKFLYIFAPLFLPMYLGYYLWYTHQLRINAIKEEKQTLLKSGVIALLFSSSLYAAAPVIDNHNLTISENETFTITSSEISAHDDDGDDITFTISNVTHGSFSSLSFTPADIDSSIITFTHNGDENAPTFDVKATANSEDSTTQSATINYTPVNDAPLIANNSLSVTEGGEVTLSSSDISATDAEGDAISFNVSSVVGGHFEKASSTVTSFSATDIDDSSIKFIHDGSESDAAFNLSATDGSDASANEAASTTTTGVNDGLSITHKTISITEGQTLTITNTMIQAADRDSDISGNETDTITFTLSNVTGGEFQNSGNPVTSFNASDISNGNVKFVHDGSETDAAFDIIANDGSVDCDGGVQSAIINFTEANDPLVGSVTITGPDAREDETLVADTTADPISDEDAPISALSYQWKADDESITGATSSTYRLTADEVGKRVTVTVSYVDSNNRTESTTSAQTAVVTGDLDGYASTLESSIRSTDGSMPGDGNNDGRLDSLQANVTSGNKYNKSYRWFTIASTSGSDDIKHTRIVNEVQPSSVPDNISMMSGLFTIELTGITPGGTVNIDVFVQYHADYNAYIKYNNITGKWDNLSGVTVTQYKEDAKTKISFSIVDGGPYDSDGVANGTILDPGGPALIGAAHAPLSITTYMLLVFGFFILAFYGHKKEQKILFNNS